MLKKFARSTETPRSSTVGSFAQWGATDRALDSLETAMRLRSPYLEQLKTAALFDPIRKEPRFPAVMRESKFSD